MKHNLVQVSKEKIWKWSMLGGGISTAYIYRNPCDEAGN